MCRSKGVLSHIPFYFGVTVGLAGLISAFCLFLHGVWLYIAVFLSVVFAALVILAKHREVKLKLLKLRLAVSLVCVLLVVCVVIAVAVIVSSPGTSPGNPPQPPIPPERPIMLEDMCLKLNEDGTLSFIVTDTTGARVEIIVNKSDLASEFHFEVDM